MLNPNHAGRLSGCSCRCSPQVDGRSQDARTTARRECLTNGFWNKILVADDDSAIRTVLNQALMRGRVTRCARRRDRTAGLWRWVQAGDGDLVITDVVMPDENAFDLLPRIKKMRPELPIIVMSAQNTFMTAIKASERGAYDYLPKPFDLKELVSIVGRAMSAPKNPPKRDKQEEADGIPLVGRSPAMQEIYRALARLMQTDLTVMMQRRRSGTGKELVARALHDYGKRRSGPFVAINMAAIPRDLIESDLFPGHEKGAFTGANARSAGRFEQAEGRHALPGRNRRRADGSADPVAPCIAAGRICHRRRSHHDQEQCPHRRGYPQGSAHVSNRAQGLFREDLFYRLNVVPLRLPAICVNVLKIFPISSGISSAWPSKRACRKNTLIRPGLIA